MAAGKVCPEPDRKHRGDAKSRMHRDVEYTSQRPQSDALLVDNGELFTFLRDPVIRDACLSGKYVLVDKRIVLRSAECIGFRDGNAHIIDWSSDFLERYTLHYEWHKSTKKHLRSRVFRYAPRRSSARRNQRFDTIFNWKKVAVEAKKVSSIADISGELLQYIVGGDGPDMPNEFSAALVWLLSRAHMTVARLSERTGLSEKTIQRLRNKPGRPALRTVIALCVGLGLGPYYGERLVELAGYHLTGSEEDQCLRLILCFATGESVASCNRWLVSCGFPPLTGGNDEASE